ncbi:1-phosphatidylinositol 3-phosphate 5-kinase [Apostichopus japonicus]|uniref:1-phosphatidylinositol-3-phosphate 5-kinase n=1 Tax=Stichopus japonicus TaxID=307972 RepID=A0A2G8L627_STIJA|nr:1-phosphatidylinositol 3-phosphate 5-kinase [Apostichopus japonicus]
MSLQILGYFVSVNYYCHAKFMLTYCSSQTSGKHLQSFHFDGLSRRVQATAMGQALLKARWLRAVPGNSDDVFKDENLFYSLWQRTRPETSSEVTLTEEGEIAHKEDLTEPNWFQEIDGDEERGSMADIDGVDNVDTDKIFRSGPVGQLGIGVDSTSETSRGKIQLDTDTDSQTGLMPPSSIPKVPGLLPSAIPIGPDKQGEIIEDGSERRAADWKQQFRYSSLNHLKVMLSQLLEQDNLDIAWFDIILNLAKTICDQVKVDVFEKDLMDIRQYVHIKKLPGGSRQECEIIHGTVCTKNITNKKMDSDLTHPNILLLAAAVEHQRVENKFVSLEPVVLQEREFLKNCVSKLIAKKPDVLIVEKSVARVAQEFLLAHGITLVSNTKPLVMARIKRSTGASLEESIEQAAQATFGSCYQFYLKVYHFPGGYSKTLMFITGCPPRLGCSVLLRGGSLIELKKILHHGLPMVRVLVHSLYHSFLEASYLCDSYALPLVDDQECLASPGLDDSQGLSSSFFEGMTQSMKGQSKDGFHDNQKSVTESIRSAMQKLMKNHTTKDTKGVEAGETFGAGINSTNDMEKEALQEDNISEEYGQSEALTGHDVQVDEHDETEAPSAEENNRTIASREKVSCANISLDVMAIESKIIPFTALMAPSGASLAASGMLPLATPIKVNHFSNILKKVQLSSSPHLTLNPPFFETDKGKESSSKKFFGDKLFSSPKLSDGTSKEGPSTNVNASATKREIERDTLFYRSLDRSTKPSRLVHFKSPHPFVDFPHLSDEDDLPALVSDFRARGGRLVSRPPKHHKSLEVLGANASKTQSNPSTSPSGSQTLPSQFNDDQGEDRVYQGDGAEIETVVGHQTSSEDLNDGNHDQVDCLDPYFHQKLKMQFSSFSAMSDNAPNYCIHPRTIHMEHYGKHDVTLGHFLDKFCFDTLYTCRSKTCETLMLQHVRRFVHGHGCVEIILRVMEKPIVDNWEDIIVWSWCRRCQEGNQSKCGHSLHMQHNQYFSRGKIVATLKYHPINVREVVLPLLPLPDQKPFLMFPDPDKEYTNIDDKGTNLLSSILQNITILTETEEACTYLEDKRADYCGMYEDHQMLFKNHLVGLQERIADLRNGSIEETETKTLTLQDAFVSARRALAQIGMAWSERFQDFFYQEKERKRREQGKRKAGEDGSASPKFRLSTSHEDEPPSTMQHPVSVSSSNSLVKPPQLTVESSTGLTETVFTEIRQQTNTGGEENNDVKSTKTSSQGLVPGVSNDQTSKDNISVSSTASGEQIGFDQTDQFSMQTNADFGISSTDNRPAYSRVRTMWNSLMTEQTAPIKLDMPFPPDQHYMLPPCNISSIVIFDKEPSSIISYTLSTDEYKNKLVIMEEERRSQSVSSYNSKASSGRTSPATTSKGPEKTVNDSTKTKSSKIKNSKRVLNFLWNKGSSSVPSVKLDEVTDEGGEVETEFGQSQSIESKEEGDLDLPKSVKDSDNAPSILYQFTDPSNSQFWCQVYFPSEFAHLRQLLFPSGEDVFIRSLARCKNWKATGGKSGSKFSKTKDDRFVLKEIQRIESHSFLQFAPHYIKYMEKAALTNQPTVLTKILGFYAIGCKNPVTNTAQKQHVIVMENLFYKRQISKIFDLKGSIRNRHVKTSGDETRNTHVLMDENLIKEMVKSPLYIPLHSKSVLTHALEGDTGLLAHHFVMDYSLLVGIDEEHDELVVGVIDFIRKFTFDKKLEMIVKASGIVGGHGKTPTILSPELYRSRFCEAMDKYFVLVPDRWTGLGKDYHGS